MKIIFVDLDDTLLTDSKTVGDEDAKMIRRLTADGHKFVVTTGRPLYSAKVIAKDYGFVGKGFILASFNGGLIYDCETDRVIYRQGVPCDIVRHMFHAAKEAGLHVHTYTDDAVISERETEEIKFYSQRIRMPYRIIESIDTIDIEDPMKLIVMSLEGKEKLIEFRDHMRDYTEGVLGDVFSCKWMLEYALPDVCKGSAVKRVCEYFGVDISDSIAMGDEENDLSMIAAAGVGVCVQNGIAQAKECADYVTERTNNENPLTEVAERFVYCNTNFYEK